MGYLPQGSSEFNFLKHLILLYGNAQRPWTVKDLKYYVAHLDADGLPDDWLYDSILFLNSKASSGRDFSADVNLGTTVSGEGDFFAVCSRNPANRNDWDELLSFYLAEGGSVETLDRAIEECKKTIKHELRHKRNVVLMLPYPHITQGDFGPLPGNSKTVDFTIRNQNLASATKHRLESCQWMVDQITEWWSALNIKHLNLLGVYWMFETIYRGWDVDDHWLLKEFRKHIHNRGLKFLWIPFWSSYNLHLLDDYQNYYFDAAFLQPNYMFYKEGKSLRRAADAARSRNAGIELEYYLELNEPIAIENERHARFREYLNGGIEFGYMKESACAHFQGVESLARMHRHTDPKEREFYEDIYQFVKGTYKIKP